MPTITFNVNGEKSRSIIRETGEVPPSRVHGVIDRGWNVLGAIAQGVTFTAWKHNEIAARQREWHSAVAKVQPPAAVADQMKVRVVSGCRGQRPRGLQLRAAKHTAPEPERRERVAQHVVGFDLNPYSVRGAFQ